MKKFLGLLGCLAAPIAVSAQEIPDLLAQHQHKSGISAVGFAFQKGREPIEIAVSGSRSKTDATPVVVDDLWHIGSVTKMFTAAMAMMLVDEGKLTLDMTLAEALAADAPDMHASWKDITLKDVLSHTGGLTANPTRKQLRAGFDGAQAQEVLAELWAKPLKKKRGRFTYSNVGYMLAGYILEQQTGKSYEALVQQRIATPLGISSIGYGAPGVILGHQGKTPVSMAAPVTDNPPFMTAAGRMHLTLEDLTKFGRFLIDACAGRSLSLSAQSCQLMFDPVADSYGLGVAHFGSLDQLGDGFGHDGSNTMWFATLALWPGQDIVAVITANEAKPQKVSNIGAALIKEKLAQP